MNRSELLACISCNADVDTIESQLDEGVDEKKTPLYIRALAGIGGWWAAIMILPFLGFLDVFDNSVVAIVSGLLLMGAAIVLSRRTRSVFPQQLGLAFAFAGDILLVVGVVMELDWDDMLIVGAVAQTAVCAIVYRPLKSTAFRFIGPVIAVILGTTWVIAEMPMLVHLLLVGEVVLVLALLAGSRRPRMLDPLMYSAAILLPVTLLVMNVMQADLWRPEFDEPMWPSSIVVTVGLLWFLVRLDGGFEVKRERRWLLPVGVAAVALSALTTPGVIFTVLLLVAGYALQDRLLTTIAFGFLPCFIVLYYYALDVSLAYKSLVLVGSGLVFLCLRLALRRIAGGESS